MYPAQLPVSYFSSTGGKPVVRQQNNNCSVFITYTSVANLISLLFELMEFCHVLTEGYF